MVTSLQTVSSTCLCAIRMYFIPTRQQSDVYTPIECDKSFTRSDALAKHMRIQHNISPPLPGRGGNRKRKREEPDASGNVPEQSPYGYSTFKIEPNTHPDDEDMRMSPGDTNGAYPGAMPRPFSPELAEYDDFEDEIPPHLLAQMDRATGLIMGRTPLMVRYLLMKAKYRWVLEHHEALLEELRVLKYEEKCWKERKDALLDELLRLNFGSVYLSLLAQCHVYSLQTGRLRSNSLRHWPWLDRTIMYTQQNMMISRRTHNAALCIRCRVSVFAISCVSSDSCFLYNLSPLSSCSFSASPCTTAGEWRTNTGKSSGRSQSSSDAYG